MRVVWTASITPLITSPNYIHGRSDISTSHTATASMKGAHRLRAKLRSGCDPLDRTRPARQVFSSWYHTGSNLVHTSLESHTWQLYRQLMDKNKGMKYRKTATTYDYATLYHPAIPACEASPTDTQ